MNVILCGMMGAGKTTVGKEIAKRMGLRWYDTDEIIAHRHGKISNIFERCGEPYFRALETEIVKELSSQDGLVLSTGGGLLLKKENRELLQTGGKIIFLRASLETLENRLRADKERPLLQTAESLRDKLTRLLQERTSVYEQAADYTVDVDEKTPQKIAEEIIYLVGIKG